MEHVAPAWPQLSCPSFAPRSKLPPKVDGDFRAHYYPISDFINNIIVDVRDTLELNLKPKETE